VKLKSSYHPLRHRREEVRGEESEESVDIVNGVVPRNSLNWNGERDLTCLPHGVIPNGHLGRRKRERKKKNMY